MLMRCIKKRRLWRKIEPSISMNSHGVSSSHASGGIGPGAAPGASHGSAGAWDGPALDPQLALTHPRAGFWIRMGALLIDLLLVHDERWRDEYEVTVSSVSMAGIGP